MMNTMDDKLTDMCVVPPEPKDPQYLNLSFTRADPEEETEKSYQEAKTRFPIPHPGTCENYKKVIDQVQLEVIAAEKARVTSMAAKGSGRPELYRINGYTQWRTELEQKFAAYNCQKALEQKEQAEVFGTFSSQLEAAKEGTEKSDKLTTYIVFGMLGLVVLVSGILIFRK